MKTELLYGDRSLWLEIPDQLVKQVVKAKPLPSVPSEEELIKNALANPIDSAPLYKLVKRGEKACVIVGDVTRLWARHDLLVPPILNELNLGGVTDDNIVIVSATGDHREQTAAEHEKLVGKEVYKRVKVIDHRARNKDELVFLGNTSYGTPVSVNKTVADADRVIITGGIVYHFLAGWGGGKKAIVPGVSAYETIMKNHALAFYSSAGKGLNPAVRAGSIDGNPCSDDMVQGASLVDPDFLVNVVMNEETHRIAKVVAGNYITAFKKGCQFVNEHFGVSVREPADLVIASCGGYPKDINFYQTYKTIYNASFALKKGGTLILVTECREGVGSDDFLHMFTAFADNRQREEALRRIYTIGGQMGYHTAVVAAEHDVLVLTAIPGADVEKMGMIPVSSLEEGLALTAKKHGGIPETIIMPHGGTTLPI